MKATARILIVKLSSLGDVLHTLPALTDARRALPDAEFHWLIEESFAEVPAWHPAVREVHTLAFRRWRDCKLATLARGEFQSAVRALRCRRYDLVLDAQGLLKSAIAARLARGPVAGFAGASAREAHASWLYGRRYRVAAGEHALVRLRRLFALALGYPLPQQPPEYGLPTGPDPAQAHVEAPYLLFLHGTSWPSKHWPEPYWLELAQQAAQAGYEIRLPWGSAAERERALRIAAACPQARVLPRLSLGELAAELRGARAAVGVDTGLVHLAAALAVPCLTLYGATDPARTGTVGQGAQHLRAEFPCAPCLQRECSYPGGEVRPACYGRIGPQPVWAALAAMLDGRRSPIEPAAVADSAASLAVTTGDRRVRISAS